MEELWILISLCGIKNCQPKNVRNHLRQMLRAIGERQMLLLAMETQTWGLAPAPFLTPWEQWKEGLYWALTASSGFLREYGIIQIAIASENTSVQKVQEITLSNNSNFVGTTACRAASRCPIQTRSVPLCRASPRCRRPSRDRMVVSLHPDLFRFYIYNTILKSW